MISYIYLENSTIIDVPWLKITHFVLIDSCTPKDDNGCLQTTPGWDETYTCESSTQYCSSYGKDMMRCCPEACNTGTFTEEDCNGFGGLGTCVYPNDAQCNVKGTF